MVSKVVHSRISDEWETPQDLFDILNDQFHFDLDAAASADNHKCDYHFTQEQDGLKQSWSLFDSVWLNPPYSQCSVWVEKAWLESQGGCTVVMLLAARTDTRWFHRYIYEQQGVHIWFIKGRLKFGGLTNSAPFPSMVVVFEGNNKAARENLWDARETFGARRR